MVQNKNANAYFTVISGEVVTVVVSANQTSCDTVGAYDGAPVVASPTDPDTYTFPVTGNSGEHFLFVCKCLFKPGSSDDAFYSVTVNDDSGNTFALNSVHKGGMEAFTLFFTIQ